MLNTAITQRHLERIASGINVGPALAQLNAHPELWNEHPNRTAENSPHYGIPDIWLRYRPLEELTSPERFREPHFATFYPAWYALPALTPIVFGLMAKVRATYLGGILITKIPPGCRVKPHDDRGSWHAEAMNCKVYVPLQANERCVNYCENDSAVMRAGEAWTFNNLLHHSVENNGDTDRITLIVCMAVQS